MKRGSRVLFNPENWDVRATANAVTQVYASIASSEAEGEDDDQDENWHGQFRSRIHPAFVRAMERLLAEKFLEAGVATRSAFKIAWVVDSEIPLIRGRAWCKRLHAPGTHARFVEWLDGKV